jgi:UDP-N-acetylglucosamine--N-acetylmuramyl-(pentapeptide) pyrophosphoryl-undecaprenol N-acetylglucosamine transferase
LRVKTLFVANAGGHLEELWQLCPRLADLEGPRAWVTFDNPQTRSLLAGEECIYAERSEPRDVVTMLRNAAQARRVLAVGGWSAVVSTGSLMAVPFLSLARLRGLPCHFIESAARTEGPSLTGRILQAVPGVHRYSQYEDWNGRPKWVFRGSVFDAFAPAQPIPSPEIRRVVVTVGSNSYDFGRLIEGLQRVLPPEAEVLWQTGHTDVSRFGIVATPFLASADLAAAMQAADLVVAHAGVGSALAALQAGHSPLLVPRRKHQGEHIDDHQIEIARRLMERGIAVECDASELTTGVMAQAAERRARAISAPPFQLDG